MADNHCTAGKIVKAFLKRPQSIYIYIIGRFVKQQHIALFLKRHGQVEAVSLAA